MLDELDKWYEASKILSNHKKNTIEEANEIIKDMDELRQVAIKSKLKWEPSLYKIDDELFKRQPRKFGGKSNRSAKSRS